MSANHNRRRGRSCDHYETNGGADMGVSYDMRHVFRITTKPRKYIYCNAGL